MLWPSHFLAERPPVANWDVTKGCNVVQIYGKQNLKCHLNCTVRTCRLSDWLLHFKKDNAEKLRYSNVLLWQFRVKKQRKTRTTFFQVTLIGSICQRLSVSALVLDLTTFRVCFCLVSCTVDMCIEERVSHSTWLAPVKARWLPVGTVHKSTGEGRRDKRMPWQKERAKRMR